MNDDIMFIRCYKDNVTMLLWNIERGISPNTCSHSLQATTFLGFLPDDVNSTAIGDLIVPQVLAWLQNPPSIDQVCSREEETQIPSGCLTERKKHRYHQGAGFLSVAG